jgi:hypothetical protein
MIAHIFRNNAGKLCWSGYNASGDPDLRPKRKDRRDALAKPYGYAFRVEVGRQFQISHEGMLCVDGPPGSKETKEFTPVALVVAARAKMFGFKLVEAEAR